MNPLAAARALFSNQSTRRRKPAHSPRTPLTIETLEQRTALAADSWGGALAPALFCGTQPDLVLQDDDPGALSPASSIIRCPLWCVLNVNSTYGEFIVDSPWPKLPVEPRELSPEAQPGHSPVDRPEASLPTALPEEQAGIPPATEDGADPSETMDEMPTWPGDESAWWPKPDDDVSDSGLDDPAPWIEPLDEPILDDWSIEDSAYDDSWEWWYDNELGWYRTRVWDGAMASPEEALEEFNEAFAGEAIDWDGVEEV